MKIGMVGLGRMGLNMARRLINGGHDVIAWNRSADKIMEAEESGATGAESIEKMVGMLEAPRTIWIMLPAGKVTDDMVEKLSRLLSEGDLIIEGGNSLYKDDLSRSKALVASGIHYADAGVSGGIWGLTEGYCIMVGASKPDYGRMVPLLETLCVPGGFMHCGKVGAGHFVKMVHNGIEYAMMEAYGEGFEILKKSIYGEDLDMSAVSSMWNRGSVIRSWLLELLEDGFRDDPSLSEVRGVVPDSGEGRWTVQEAIDLGVAAPAIGASLFRRFDSTLEDPFALRVMSTLRNRFGGHKMVTVDPSDSLKKS
ncbi:MAG: 6-phosphogluconate dehydrogenase (decarboxylating) [Candidatus Wallbacteria bacterium HGW-Wallbacteria-1]|jgi:6-phosphogluconate dehydrogenase|uniref:6-phosphogluconate dehydrogenase (Decarboxylating) n=1 Tax=Candidatus Wallbacteria bacterium HGW-Wallbacteria-1 TaxID=2013854 RepID=A0A2N1PQZ3_9BACT|nr:MAG: 6-phosphogluconate dehydrogenase (decarboxylating) [Candidatus Wallbacteria bacterium HGW-Wallbacteria-1]